jgi:AraC-like DNA-binding protein
MPLYEPLMPIRYALPLLHFLRSQDPACLEAILLEAQLPASTFSLDDASLSMAQFDALLSAASRQLQRSDLGFELGRLISIDDHSALVPLLRSSHSLEQLLRTLERYWRLITTSFRVRYIPGERTCEWRIGVAAPMSQATMRMTLELLAVSCFRDFKRLLGSETRIDIYLSIPAPPHGQRYARLGADCFHFSASALPEIRCLLPARAIDLPLRLPARQPAPQSGAQLSNLLPRGLASRYGGWVELMLREAEGMQPSLQELAGMLSMSARNLTRKLAAEGINLRQLALDIRHQRACRLLLETRLSIAETGARLGYADPSAFIRAFRQRAGSTPAQYRRAAMHDPCG